MSEQAPKINDPEMIAAEAEARRELVREGDQIDAAGNVNDDAVRAADIAAAELLRNDPATQKWLDETRRGLADGTFDREVAAQPPISEVIAELKARRQT